ncbi:hypothetical protein KEJ36_02865 [Candidatus Bathyarchaeota archaeon]|nr:hypothetical protein [Candidatus Bathyarchaeota archaeon]
MRRLRALGALSRSPRRRRRRKATIALVLLNRAFLTVDVIQTLRRLKVRFFMLRQGRRHEGIDKALPGDAEPPLSVRLGKGSVRHPSASSSIKSP